jgi:molecular chaperone DnaK
VTFDIDANGILHVTAKDKGTGKEQSIQIRASSGLSEDEINRMVDDAEAHAEEDRKARELVESRNQADNLIHAARKSLDEVGDKASDEEKKAVEDAITEVEEALKGDDKDTIDTKTQALAEASGKLAEKLYQDADGQADAGSADGQGASDQEDVVDAEFEEVKDDEKK